MAKLLMMVIAIRDQFAFQLDVNPQLNLKLLRSRAFRSGMKFSIEVSFEPQALNQFGQTLEVRANLESGKAVLLR